MKQSMPFVAGGLILMAALIAGCASIEFKPSSKTTDISMQPKADTAEQVSPPAQPGEAQPPPSQEPASEPAAEKAPAGPLNLTIEGAIVMALENNQGLQVQEVNPALQNTFVSEQRAAFDPVFDATYTQTGDRFSRDLLVRTTTSVPNASGQGSQSVTSKVPVDTKVETKTEDGAVGLTERLPTGTDVSVSVGRTRTETRNSSTNPDLAYGTDTNVDSSDLNLQVTQQLLKGAGLGVNLASLRQARLDRLSSDYELRGVVEDLVSQVEQTYWDCVLAQRQIKIFEDSLAVAQQQADEVNERIRIGKLAESERAGADAEVASRKSSLIDARSNYDTLRLALLRLVNPSGNSLRPVDLNLMTDPTTPKIALTDVDDSIRLAEQMRPDLNQARLLIKRDDLDVVKTKNGLLPQLDVFISLSKALNHTQYTESFLVGTQVPNDDRYTTQVGAQFSYPLGNRAARAQKVRAELARTRDFRALANMAQLVEQDVRGAYIEVGRSQEQIAATAAARALQEETLKVETEKFRLGRSTVLLVAQAQRDLLSAQINEVQAVAAYLKAIVNLYRLEGSLLERRGVNCPGREPVELENGPVVRTTQASNAAAPATAAEESGGKN